MRQITADFSSFAGLADAETPSAVSVTFALTQTIGADGDLVLKGEYTFATDDAGVLDVWLVVPDDADTGAPYTCYLPSNESFSFVLAAGSAIDLLELWVLATVPVASLAEALLASYTPLATFAAHAALAGGAALGHVKNGGNVTINADGTMTAAVGGAPSGPAGGVLSGTYPDPSFAVDMATQAELNAEIARATTAEATKEASLGNPGTDGYVLSSTALGVRSWIPNETVPGAWINLTLLGTWVQADFGGSPITPSYRVNGSVVEFRGAVKNGADSSFIASGLPAAAYRQEDVCRSAVAGILRADVDGTLRHIAGSLTIIGLDAFSYRTTT